MNNCVVQLHDRLAPDVAFATRSAAVATGTTGVAVMRSYDLHASVAEVRVLSGSERRKRFDDCDSNMVQAAKPYFVGCWIGAQFCVPVVSSALLRAAGYLWIPQSQYENIVLCYDSHATPLPPSDQE